MAKEQLDFHGLLKWGVVSVGAQVTPGLEREQKAANIGATFGALVETLGELPTETRSAVIDNIEKKIASITENPPVADPLSGSFPVGEVGAVTDFLRSIQDFLG